MRYSAIDCGQRAGETAELVQSVIMELMANHQKRYYQAVLRI